MKTTILTILLFYSCFELAIAQSTNDREAISETVQLYFDGMMMRDKAKLRQAFIPEARLIGYRGEDFTLTTFDTWAEATSKGEPRDPATHKNEIVSIRVQGNAASVETELYWPGIYYYDFLTLMKIDGQWKIVNKSWSEKKL
ncbi:nuclear transport factor 2 family protein [Algoriphagus pacificus]|uniref:Nuclear transport factor 2 family protein n=1 Tax=Algoriphagus pacificus TaxID=2811234 RepID=A0ABS3CAD3_9BACT|nr:nuclear transport factor 2 family protein [Algoriphagus pacificus]MBN7814069.1 nuclear transport factor 2 family protein [Algoriphagus pacificus]